MDEEEQLMTRRVFPILHLCAITIVLGGVQFGWALQLALLTPFVQTLGVPHALSTIVWLVGPISGLIVQPLIGSSSDRCTSRFGRRRPYLVGGAAFVLLAMFLISCSSDIGYWMGDALPTADDESLPRPRAIVVFTIGFWILDVSNNVMQGPCRALLSDLVASSQQELGFSLINLWIALGNILGYVAGYINWVEYLPSIETKACGPACSNLRLAFALAAFFVVVTSVITTKTSPEIVFVPSSPPPAGNSLVLAFKDVWREIKNLSLPMKWTCVVMFCNWVGWYCYILFDTDWFGRVVWGGSPDSSDPSVVAAYNAGVRQGSLGLMFQSALAFLASFVLPPLALRLELRYIWAIGMFIFGVLLVLTPVYRSTLAGFFYFSLLGISWAILLVVPFTLTSKLSNPSNRGILFGVLNIAVVAPQLCVSALSPLINLVLSKAGEDSGAIDEKMFIIGGIVSILGLVFVRKLPVGKGSLHSDAEVLLLADQSYDDGGGGDKAVI